MATIYAPIIENEAAYYSAVKRNIVNNAKVTFRRTFDDAEAIEDFIAAGRTEDARCKLSYTDNFVGSLAKAFDTYGKLSERQVEAVRKSLAERAARRAEWAAKDAALNAARQHIGEVGQKVCLELTLKKVIEIQHPQFHYYDSGTSLLFILEDAERNVVIYKGTAAVLCKLKEGETIKINAVVKEHGVRNAVKQTVIQRPAACK